MKRKLMLVTVVGALLAMSLVGCKTSETTPVEPKNTFTTNELGSAVGDSITELDEFADKVDTAVQTVNSAKDLGKNIKEPVKNPAISNQFKKSDKNTGKVKDSTSAKVFYDAGGTIGCICKCVTDATMNVVSNIDTIR